MQNWLTKKIWICVLGIALCAAVTVSVFKFSDYIGELNLLALVATLAVLIWYAYDTNRIANESVSQTELQTMPIMCLYIRNVTGIEAGEKREAIKQYAVTQQTDNAIVPSPFYFALRSMGSGAAFNVRVESDDFKVEKYQTQFFAPHKDEHAVKIIRKPNDKIRDILTLNNSIFTISCSSVDGKVYEYKYKIVDISNRKVEFLN